MKKILLLILITSIFYTVKANNYYWVGGTGNWSQFATHWATSSGGSTFHIQVPQSTDNVYFDSNSFSTVGQTITLDVTTPACNNMDWTGVTNTPTINGNSKTLNVYGSLKLVTGMTSSSLNISFNATSMGNTITTAGRSLGSLTLDGIGGGWILQDALTAGIVTLTNGSFNTNSVTCNLSSLQSSNSNVRSINLGTSTLNFSIDPAILITTTTNLTFSGASSIINVTGNNAAFSTIGLTFNIINFTNASGSFNYGPYIANTVTFAGNCSLFRGANTIGTLIIPGTLSGSMTGSSTITNATFGGTSTINTSNTFGTLNLTGAGGTTYTLNSGTTQTITTALNIASGNCSAFNIIKSSSSGSQATLNMTSGTVTADYVNLKDIKALGGATFNASNAIDQGNNIGWNIATLASRNLYWIGGTGNWSSGSNWSLTSGGVSSGCAPISVDNVYFDSNSFSAVGQTITLDVTTPACNNMDWTGVTNTPTINGNSKTLNVYGSLKLVTGMTSSSLNISFNATSMGNTITTAGRSLGSLTLDGIGGGWILQDALTAGIVTLTNGSFNTNSVTCNLSSLQSSNSNVRSINLGTSTLNFSIDPAILITTTTNLTFSGASSIINVTGNNAAFSTIGLTFNIINFTNASGSFNYGPYIANTVTFAGNCSLFRGANTIGTLIIPGTLSGSMTGSSTITNATFGGTSTINTSNTFGTLNLTGAGLTYTLNSGTTQTITTALNITGGTGGFPVNLKSSTLGTQATIYMASGSICTDYIRLTDIKATGGATFTAGPSSQNVSNTIGWTFISGIPNPSVSITASTGSATCESASVTFTANYTNGGLARNFEWFVKGVSVQNSSLNTYTTSSLTNGSTVYAVISAYPTTCSFAQVVNSNTLTIAVNPLPTATISGTTSIQYGQTNPGVTFTGANGTSPYTFTYNINGGTNTTVTTTSGNSITIGTGTTAADSYAYNLISVEDASPTSCNQAQTGTATITINKATQNITFPAFESKIVNDVDFEPGATVDSSLPLTYTSSVPSVATVYQDVADGNKWKIKINGAGNSYITAIQVGNSNYNSTSFLRTLTVGSTLPIDLKNYNVKLQNNTEVLISWATASESNNSHFEVLKSTDGIGFKLIAKVEALGNSAKGNSYMILDKTPSKGVNYYQLIQFDKEGTMRDLGVKFIRFDLVNITAINIYPNPTIDRVNVKFDVDKFETIEVLDLSGKLIFKKIINKTDSDIALDLTSEPSSIYLIKLSGKEGDITKQIIKK